MRIYAYPARPPFEAARIVQDQLRLAVEYQRALVEIERERRLAVEALYRDACTAETEAFRKAREATALAVLAVRTGRSTGGDMLPPDEDMKRERRGEAKLATEMLTKARAEEKTVREAWYAARRKATPTLKAAMKAIDERAYARQKAVYNFAGDDLGVVVTAACANLVVMLHKMIAEELAARNEATTALNPPPDRLWTKPIWNAPIALAWGTRLRVGESAERAGKAAMKEGFDGVDPVLPKFPRHDGGGRIAVQLQGGQTPAEALGGNDTRFRIDIVDMPTWMTVQDKSAFTARKRDGRVVPLPQPDLNSKRSNKLGEREVVAIVRLRVGSSGRTPIFAAWPVVLGRTLPPDSQIKWAEMHAMQVGPRLKWRLLVTVDDGLGIEKSEDKKAGVTTYAPAHSREEGPRLAVNLGWRNLPDTDGEIRVAYAVGSDGYEKEVRVPVAYVRGVAHVASLASIRKKNFNEAVKALDDWLDEMEWPAVLVEAAKWRDRWLAPKKLVRFVGEWRRNRFAGDSRVWQIASKWIEQDRHLWFWESDEREKLLKMRRDFYRCVAAEWAEKYARIVVTDMDLRDFAAKDEEAADATDKVQRVTQRIAAPSELRAAILNAASTRGTTVVERNDLKNAAGTVDKPKWIGPSMIHNDCGAAGAFDARAAIMLHCLACDGEFDQDRNHCQNLLASDEVMRKRAEALAPAEKATAGGEESKKTGRWQKRRSKTGSQRVDNTDGNSPSCG